ncbi:MAG: hypothetical protein ACPG06_01095 [Alphaproteobacteria bacterium]
MEKGEGISHIAVTKNDGRTKFAEVDDPAASAIDVGIAPYLSLVAQQVSKFREEARGEAAEGSFDSPTIFVEGVTDKAAVERALSILKRTDIVVVDAGGAQRVAERVLCWRFYAPQVSQADRTPCIGIFDCDEEGKKAYERVAANVDCGRQQAGNNFGAFWGLWTELH